MSYAKDAEDLLSGQPDCQSWSPHKGTNNNPECQPGCIHEQLAVARAGVHAQLGIISMLDTIAAHLETISLDL
jgi:hypothetical protein